MSAKIAIFEKRDIELNQAKVIGAVLAFSIYGLTYLVTNHFHIFEPRLLSMTSIDTSVSYLPWTAVIYLSCFVIPFAPLILINDKRTLDRYFIMFAAIMTIHCVFFVFHPTIYPREAFTNERNGNFLMTIIHFVDSPANSFPSLHISVAFLPAFVMWMTNKKYALPMLIWAALISVSTLTTKQHYLMDIFAGFGVCLFVVSVGNLLMKKDIL